MKRRTYICISLAFVVFISSTAFASAPDWKIDTAHSGVYFRIKHIYSSVNGFFPDFEGDIKFDPSNLDSSRFVFKVKVKSIDTNDGKRDGHLLSDEFFDAKKYPEMSFESQSITKQKENQYIASGVMKIKDVSKTIQLPFTFFGTKPNPFNPKQDVAGFETKFTIDRLAYHVGNGKFLKMGVVGKDVDVLISIEATREK